MFDLDTIKARECARAQGQQDAENGRYDPDLWGREGDITRSSYEAGWASPLKPPLASRPSALRAFPERV